MTWTPWTESRVRLAALFVAVAVVIAARSAVVAVREDIVAPSAPLRVVAEPERTASAPAASGAFEQLDPFGTSRMSPSEASPAMVAPPAPITLVGTVLGTQPLTAVCRMGSLPPRLLHVGDTLGGWRLQQITAGRVVFTDASGASHELRLSSVGK